jgi:hypothetical protein
VYPIFYSDNVRYKSVLARCCYRASGFSRTTETEASEGLAVCSGALIALVAIALAHCLSQATLADAFGHCSQSDRALVQGFTQPAIMNGLVFEVRMPALVDSEVAGASGVLQSGVYVTRFDYAANALPLSLVALVFIAWIVVRWLDLRPNYHWEGPLGLREDYVDKALYTVGVIFFFFALFAFSSSVAPPNERACLGLSLVPSPADAHIFDAVVVPDRAGGNWTICVSPHVPEAIVRSHAKLRPVSPGTLLALSVTLTRVNLNQHSCFLRSAPNGMWLIGHVMSALALLVAMGAVHGVGLCLPSPPPPRARVH